MMSDDAHWISFTSEALNIKAGFRCLRAHAESLSGGLDYLADVESPRANVSARLLGILDGQQEWLPLLPKLPLLANDAALQAGQMSTRCEPTSSSKKTDAS